MKRPKCKELSKGADCDQADICGPPGNGWERYV